MKHLQGYARTYRSVHNAWWLSTDETFYLYLGTGALAYKFFDTVYLPLILSSKEVNK